jgi:S-adenosylmethionine:tRNA-ribosyltransferase-isomerase (queuine synthetase)
MKKMKVLKSEYIKKGNKWILENESIEVAIVNASHWKDWQKFDKHLKNVKSELALNGGILYYYITTNKDLNKRVKWKNLFEEVEE